MTQFTGTLLEDLKKMHFPGLDLPAEFILPAYRDQSVLNIPATVCDFLGVPPIQNHPLRQEIIAPMKGDIKRVILILMDALALHRLINWLQKGDILVWNELLKSGSLSPITSISPSTTSTAMTTLWTGQSPAEHGVAGYELWLKQYGLVANMILHSPMSYHGNGANLAQAGFDPDTVLTLPTMGEHLASHGVSTHAFQHYSIANSGLSRTFMKNANINPFGTEAECWVNMRELIQKKINEKLYIWAYWGAYDHLSHLYGPDDERSELYFANFSRALEENLIKRMTPEQRKGTLLILTADHGQVMTAKDPNHELSHHPEFMNCLHIKPTGESRCTYMHLKPGKETTLRDYIASTWPNKFVVMKSQDLIDSGFFGPGVPMADMTNRVGDLTVLAKGNNYFWWADEENPLLGRHGGLSPHDMLVPFLTARL
jgi:predicted AlkP superfamily pyrophosphatase or phosphodiesterase